MVLTSHQLSRLKLIREATDYTRLILRRNGKGC